MPGDAAIPYLKYLRRLSFDLTFTTPLPKDALLTEDLSHLVTPTTRVVPLCKTGLSPDEDEDWIERMILVHSSWMSDMQRLRKMLLWDEVRNPD